jgi:TonB-dependent SusC/RagA subfamily outer membrane receptor
MTATLTAPVVHAQRTTVLADANHGALDVSGELFSRPVTVRVDDVSLKRAVTAIAASAGIRIQYQAEVLDAVKAPVTLHASRLALGAVLQRVLQGTGLRAIALDADLVMIKPDAEVKGQEGEGTVIGQVVDSANGTGIANATVTIAGTKLSAMTSAQGRFVLARVPAGEQTLTIRMLGYRSARRSIVVTAAKRTPVKVALAATANVLSGVVTTATGQQRRLEVGSDITILNADSIMKTAPITSVTDLLEGRVPGLTVVHTSGTPGDPSRLRLRGAASIQRSNDPIVIVDGVRMYYAEDNRSGASAKTLPSGGQYPRPSPLDQIDPNSIQTIEVFKGPSASAMYGSDAANCVIVIIYIGVQQWR